jgi:hypothetical protein
MGFNPSDSNASEASSKSPAAVARHATSSKKDYHMNEKDGSAIEFKV